MLLQWRGCYSYGFVWTGFLNKISALVLGEVLYQILFCTRLILCKHNPQPIQWYKSTYHEATPSLSCQTPHSPTCLFCCCYRYHEHCQNVHHSLLSIALLFERRLCPRHRCSSRPESCRRDTAHCGSKQSLDWRIRRSHGLHITRQLVSNNICEKTTTRTHRVNTP